LKRQNDLTILSLNCAIDIGSSPTGLTAFLTHLKTLPLHSLSLQSDGSMPFSFGQLLIPLLKSPSMRVIEHLDITNQSIGENGLDLLNQLLEHGELTDLRFDGSALHSFDLLSRFCETILASRLRFASFPAQDFENIFRLLPIGEDADLLNERRDDLRRRFAVAYGLPADRAERVQLIFAATIARRPSDMDTRLSSPLTRSRSITDGDLQLPEGLSEARRMSEAQTRLFRECIDPDDLTDDPVLLLMKTIQDRLTLSTILSEAP
jgi:hypothetical protein